MHQPFTHTHTHTSPLPLPCFVATLQGTELFVLPQIGYNYDLGKTPIPPIRFAILRRL